MVLFSALSDWLISSVPNPDEPEPTSLSKILSVADLPAAVEADRKIDDRKIGVQTTPA